MGSESQGSVLNKAVVAWIDNHGRIHGKARLSVRAEEPDRGRNRTRQFSGRVSGGRIGDRTALRVWKIPAPPPAQQRAEGHSGTPLEVADRIGGGLYANQQPANCEMQRAVWSEAGISTEINPRFLALRAIIIGVVGQVTTALVATGKVSRRIFAVPAVC